MSRVLDQRIVLLVISFITSLQSTKVLSEWKKCGDRECESNRVQATTDYSGPDCRYLNFKTGEEIIVYSKLSRKNENLWTGSKGKDFGYFPKDAVKVEEVLIVEEVEVLTKETDFLCLDGDEYVFENEDSALLDPNKESEYSASDAESKLQENELLNHIRDSNQNEEGVESVFGNDSKESQSQEESASEKLVTENENRNEDAEQPEIQDSLPLKPIPAQSSWIVSDIAGWFTTGNKNDEETLKAITESLEENSYRGRKIVTAENELEEPNDKEEQEPIASGWFQGGLTDFLYFGKEKVDVGPVSEKNDPEVYDVPGVDGHSDNEHETAVMELLIEEQNIESQKSQSNWFNLGLSNVLNFGHAEKDTIATEDQQSRATENKASKNEEMQALNQKVSRMDKESKETVKAVTDEDEIYAKEIIDSNSNMPNAGEIPASVHTLSDTKSTSSSTGSYFDILIGNKEEPVEPYHSEQELVSESWIYQILLCLDALEITELMKSVFSAMTSIIKKAVASLPEEMRPGPDLYGFPWELVFCAAIVGAFTVFLFLYRSYQSVSVQIEIVTETHEKLNKSNSELNQEIANLEKELEEEKSKQSENDNLVRINIILSLLLYQINTERLKTSVQDAVDENCHLQESEKQLLKEAEGWDERFSELNEQTKMFESSKTDIEEVLKNKESQVKSLTQYLLKMKDWSSAIRDDDDTEDDHWDTDIKGETENGEHLGMICFNRCFKNREPTKFQESGKIKNLQSEQVSLQSENERFESEVQKLQQKLKVMTELYQENEMKLHRKLTVEERERLQKEEKLSKVDEKINHAAEELNSYRQRAKDLEEELERTIRSYQNQLTARAAERHLNDIRKENAHNRQKLTEAEFKLDLLEKDPYALDVPVRPFGREHSPYGPSPMGRPSSETRAFLSPPTLLEGPLRLSPMLPGGGGGRGSRGPGSTVMYEASNERGELSSDRLPDPHRPPSDTGSLSPPWDRERRIILPPPGEPYSDPVLPPRRQERFFPNPPNTGRLSGPAELRTYNMQSFDKTGGNSNFSVFVVLQDSLPDQPLASESEAVSSGFAPPPFPPVRPPLMPMDPRGPFMRRGPPFPPPPPAGMYGPRECFPVRDFGPPRPPMPSM
uniref:SH3 domain-containing protein n=1 Tax=Anser brachyrhynchus TaxID=132585 RepID=A0A8B9BUB9_9AVES